MMSFIALILIRFLNVYQFVIFIYAILTWFPELGKIRYYFHEVVAPVLKPIERALPYQFRPFSVLIALILIQVISTLLMYLL